MQILLIFFTICFLYFVTKRKKLEKQVELFNRLLYIEKNPEKYIGEVDKLLIKFQSERERNINLIQKTTGLFFAGKFDEAIIILQNEVSKIPASWQVIYYHNLLLSMYFRGRIEKANEILSEVKDTLDVYYKKDYNKVTVELIYAISNFYNGNYEKCKEFFNYLIEISNNEYRIAMGYYFAGKIQEIEEKFEDAEDNFEKAKTYGHGSFIENL